MIVTVEEVANYLGIDDPDEMVTSNINRAIKSAESFLTGSLGSDYPTDDPRVKEMALIVISDLYDNRGLTETVSGNVRRLFNDFAWQIRLEMRRKEHE